MLGLKEGANNPFLMASHFNSLGIDKPLGVAEEEATGGYWPSYLFSDGEVGQKIGSVSLPMGMGARGGAGGRAHAANEWFAIEGPRWDSGLSGAEKIVAASLYEYSRITTVPPRPKTTASSK
jgi:hypothetical protein